MTDPDGRWLTDEEIEAERRSAWALLSAEEKLDHLQEWLDFCLEATGSIPGRPKDGPPQD